jgi:CBS domain-containing protein
MHDERIGSVVITDDAQRPQGVFTLHDLLSRVTLPQTALDCPIVAVMTPSPVSLPPLALAYDAALIMARHGFSHVCVVEAGRLVGVVSEGDLFALQQVGLVNLSRAIAGAPSLAALAQAGGDMQRLIDRMLVQGASVAQLNQIITLLNDQIARRVIALCAEQEAPATAFTWLAFGSEGRQEQTLKTDQDNGILFIPAPGQTSEAVRAQLLPFARRVNDALATVGYPLCPGGIMAGNPECCLSLSEWRARFDAWIVRGEPADLLNAAIFFDFRVLHGDEAPAQALGEAVRAQAAATPRFLRQMAENALNNQPPLGLLRDFVVESSGPHPRTLDLKLRGATPFVDGARLLVLARGVAETNTLARLRALGQIGVVPAEEAAAWSDAYAYVQLLRMRQHQRQARAGEALDNHIDPDDLNELDRRILKEAFRQARKLQARIALDYQL